MSDVDIELPDWAVQKPDWDTQMVQILEHMQLTLDSLNSERNQRRKLKLKLLGPINDFALVMQSAKHLSAVGFPGDNPDNPSCTMIPTGCTLKSIVVSSGGMALDDDSTDESPTYTCTFDIAYPNYGVQEKLPSLTGKYYENIDKYDYANVLFSFAGTIAYMEFEPS